MKRIYSADKRINEGVEDGALVAILTQMTNDSNLSTVLTDDADETGNYQTLILNYIQKLEGYRIRLRELHWSAERMSAHKLTDDLMNTLVNIEDDIAEDLQGFLGIRIGVGTVSPVMPEAKDIKSLLETIKQETLSLRETIDGVPDFVGIVSMLDDLVHSMNKSLYLETLG